MISNEIEISELSRFLEKIKMTRFYGKVEVTYESGTIVLIKTTETIKPANLKIFINA